MLFWRLLLIIIRRSLTLKDDFGSRTETFVVGVFDDLTNVNVLKREMQDVIGPGVSGKPVLSINLLPVRDKPRCQVLVIFLVNVRHVLAAGLHDLEIVIVNPYAPLKITLVLFDTLRRDIKDISINLIHVLRSRIQ